jgi:hypothetical protein
MGIMANIAVGLHHAGTMGLVTLNAFGNNTVSLGMAEITGHLGMLGGGRRKIVPLRIMAGNADGFQFPLQSDHQRLVRIMATGAFGQVKVRSASMTRAALGDILCAFGSMRLVAFLAGHRCFVGHAVGSDIQRLLIMTFFAIRSYQSRPVFCLLRQGRPFFHKENKADQTSYEHDQRHDSLYRFLHCYLL